jgi:signal transduction histidine kinase
VIRFIEKILSWIEDTFSLSGSQRPDDPKNTSEPNSPNESWILPRQTRQYLRQLSIKVKRKRGLILRALICWSIGLLALHLDEVGGYDFRLDLRGDQSPSNDIVIIDITESDLNGLFPYKNPLRDLKDDAILSNESRYWDINLWRQALRTILDQNPTAVGINFFFDERVGRDLATVDWNLFTDDRVVWMGALSQDSLVQLPPFADQKKQNFGFGEFLRDEDGMLRSIPTANPRYPTFGLKLAEKSLINAKDFFPAGKVIINFRGSGKSFRHIPFQQVLSGEISPRELTRKTVIIGTSIDISQGFISPVGTLSRSEVVAHVTDNLIHKRWIKRIPKPLAFAELFLVMLISVFLMNYYPQKVAFVFLTFLGLSLAASSIWFFDTFYFWTPAFSPIIQIGGTWTLFVGYLASRMEHKNWQLEQERRSLVQLEQLKNNFVSLISHDLKTPIAKIQAIVDRLLLSEQAKDLTQDLKTLRGSSDELHRYIQSILKILRVESKDFHLNIEIADINELVEKAVQQLNPLALEKGIKVQQALEPLFSVEVDATLILEVLINILENAIKYTPPEGTVWIETHEVDRDIMIRVRDNGEGIRPEELEDVFGKFVRGKNQDLKTKGSGLGLYLVKYFIELHGGRVGLTSEFGNGTTIDLYLPTEG